VHRDLKPENVMLPEKGGLKLVDFGLARATRLPDPPAAPPAPGAAQEEGASQASVAGTPGYIAPEQFAGAPGDARVDVFALGVILGELVTGRRPSGEVPNTAESTTARPPPIDEEGWSRAPRALREVALRMLAPDPSARIQDGAAAFEALRALATSGAAWEGAPRRAWSTLAGIVGGLAIVLTGAIFGGRRALQIRARERLLAAPPPPGMVLIRGGSLRLGSTEAEVDAICVEIGPTCNRARVSLAVPPRDVIVRPFYLDAHEVTNAEMVGLFNSMQASFFVLRDEEEKTFRFVRFAQGLGHEGELLFDLWGVTAGIEYVPAKTLPTEEYRLVPGRERWPASMVTFFGARLYCATHGKRLPTEDEWEAAARGGENRPYPWGNAPIRCGMVTVPPDGKTASEPGCPPTPTPRDVGTSPQDVTPEGVYDLGGNLAEWTDTIVTEAAGAVANTADADRQRAVRGGSYYGSLAARTSIRTTHLPNGPGPNGGFRCAISVAEP
jgi:formylglycine-generating enzyme required for sulfatase activity